MIQLSFALDLPELPDALADAAAGGLPEPFVAERLDGEGAPRTRLTAVWPEGDLAHGRRAMAALLARLPADTRVEDLLVGHAEPAGAAVARLTPPPDAGNAFAVRHGHLGDRVVARLMGLYQLGRPDIVTEVAPDVPFERLTTLFGQLAAHQLAADGPPPPGELLPYGYWMLTLGSSTLHDDATWRQLRDALGTGFLRQAFDARMATPAPNVLVEAELMDPDQEYQWVYGVSRCLRVLDAQARALTRLGVAGAPASPCAADVALVCSRVEGAAEVFAQRARPRAETDSGWQFGCADPDHVHDDETVRFAAVDHLAGRFPEIVQYLGLPAGWVVHRDEVGWWLQAPGDDRAYLDQECLLGPPWLSQAERERALEGFR